MLDLPYMILNSMVGQMFRLTCAVRLFSHMALPFLYINLRNNCTRKDIHQNMSEYLDLFLHCGTFYDIKFLSITSITNVITITFQLSTSDITWVTYPLLHRMMFTSQLILNACACLHYTDSICWDVLLTHSYLEDQLKSTLHKSLSRIGWPTYYVGDSTHKQHV